MTDDRIIVALDVPTIEDARTAIASIGDAVSYYKIGHQLAFIGGLELARELKADGKKVFLDLKLLDIDNTVASGVKSVISLGVDMLTLHAYPKAMRAAVQAAQTAQEGAQGAPLTLLGVTVLTSMDEADLLEAGYTGTPEALVKRRAEQARDAKMGGLVCSAAEAAAVRAIIGPDMALVTPGIRPVGADHGDQKRVVTPVDAIEAGASHLVIGRPIMGAEDRRQAALDIAASIAHL